MATEISIIHSCNYGENLFMKIMQKKKERKKENDLDLFSLCKIIYVYQKITDIILPDLKVILKSH